MKVRVFVPRAPDPDDGSTFAGTDHSFPLLPSTGHLMRLTGDRQGDFIVANVGFVQDGDYFLAAVWLEHADSKPVNAGEPVGDRPRSREYRDINFDVPPDSMMGY
jgi:hypothetical protein